MSAQSGADLRLYYGPQGAQQSGAALVLSGTPPAPTRTMVTSTTSSRWSAGVASHTSTRAPMVTTRQADPSARAPWVRGAHRNAQSNAAWGVASRRDSASAASWGQFGAVAAVQSLSNWLVAQRMDAGRAAPWGRYSAHASVEPLATWVVSDKRDAESATRWGRYVLVDLTSAPTWPGGKPGDAERYSPWTKFSRQLAPGWGVVTPPGDPEGTEALFYILPARFYMAVHNVFAQRLPDLADVPIFDVSVAADEDSYCWTLQASAPGSVFDLLFPADGVPAQLLLTMDGIEWVFVIDPPDDSWEFAKTRTTIHGRSVTSIAGAQNSSTRSNIVDRTAQQIALEALADSGIDLDWGIGAGALANGGLVDWLVPAGAWSHRGTPLDAVQTIVQAAGGYLQSHRTAAKLLARHPYGQRIGDVSGAPWAWATGAPDVELAQDVVLNQGRRYKTVAGINAAYISGATYGLLALVKRAGTAGNKLGEMVVDQLITHVDAARQRGLSIIGPSSGMFYDPVLELPVLTGPGQPGVLEVGQVVQVNANVPWRGRVRSVGARYNRPTLRQTVVMERYFENTGATMHSAGMTSSTNIFRALRDLIPEAPRQVATVAAVHAATGDSTITWPEGSQQRVLGTSVPAGSKAFVRNGLIEGVAPDLPFVTIDV